MFAFISSADIVRWKSEKRYDILSDISGNDKIWAGDRILTSDGSPILQCSYLEKNGEHSSCAIYETRPDVCKRFHPGSSEMCPLYYRK